MLSIIGFLIALGPLVVFHEFGHYLLARLFGVKAEIFSVGFGPKLWGRRFGETEWRFSLIPLGGYVKLLGDDGDRDIPAEDERRTLGSKKPWQRFLIFFGGPLFNFVLAVLIFMTILAIGDRQPASVVGRVIPGTPAATAGFVSGDRIRAIGGQAVTKWQEVERAISLSPGQSMSFEVLREETNPPKTLNLQAVPERQEGFSQYGEVTQVGEIDGLVPWGRSGRVGVSDPGSAAARAGVRTGDKVVTVNGVVVSSWERIEKLYSEAPVGSTVVFSIAPKDRPEDKTALRPFSFVKPSASAALGEVSGLRSSELFVEKAVEKAPAAVAGLRAGDRLISVGRDAKAVESFLQLRELVQKSGEKDGKVLLRWERDGRILDAELTPTATETVDPVLRKQTQFTVGVVPMLEWAPPIEVIEQFSNPITLFQKAIGRMVELSHMNLVSIGKMIRGDVSMAVMGGPIAIGKIAGDSLTRGLTAFLTTMAMLSVGLGVLNLLPIPVLDGGHLMLLAIEAVRGRPLTLRQMEVVQQVGLSLILLLMVIVIRNDIARLPFFR